MGWGASNLYYKDHEALDVSWAYNWGYKIDQDDPQSPINNEPIDYHHGGMSEFNPNTVFVPMIWCTGSSSDAATYLDARLKQQLGLPSNSNYKYDGYLLIANEPFANYEGQCAKNLRYKNETDLYYDQNDPDWYLEDPLWYPDHPVGNDADVLDFNISLSGHQNAWRLVKLYDDIRGQFPNAKIIGPSFLYSYHINHTPKRVDLWRELYKFKHDTYPDVSGFAIHTYHNRFVEEYDFDGENIYAGVSAADLDEDYVRRFINDYFLDWKSEDGDLELWVTEFGYCSGYSNNTQMLEQFVNYLETNPHVNKYSPFVNRSDPYRHANALEENGHTSASEYHFQQRCDHGKFYDPLNNRSLFSETYHEICYIPTGYLDPDLELPSGCNNPETTNNQTIWESVPWNQFVDLVDVALLPLPYEDIGTPGFNFGRSELGDMYRNLPSVTVHSGGFDDILPPPGDGMDN